MIKKDGTVMGYDAYRTVGGRGESLYEDRRSEFLGCAVPVSSEEEATEFIKSVKKQHPAARHNVWAYILRSGAERYSDDGEPQGSAGMPMLEVLRKSGVCDVAVVVTRYFGGILLGTGGLLRAYSAAAKQALDDAGVIRMVPLSLVRIVCGYSDHRRISAELSRFGAATVGTEFGAEVAISVSVAAEKTDALIARVTEMTAGRVIPTREGMTYGRDDAS